MQGNTVVFEEEHSYTEEWDQDGVGGTRQRVPVERECLQR